MQMADDDKLEPNDDPWAGLEADGLPDLTEGFAFSFEEEPAQAAEEAPEDVGETFEGFEAFAEPLAEQPVKEHSGTAESVAEEALSEPPIGEGEERLANASLSLPEGLAELLSAAADEGTESAMAGHGEFTADPAADDAAQADDDAIGDWLDEPEAESAAPGLSVFSSDDDESNDAGGIDPTVDLLSEQSSVQIGTGSSGIASPSSIEAFGSGAGTEDDGGPFAALGGDEAAEADPWAALNDEGVESSVEADAGMPAFADSGNDAIAAESDPEPEVEAFAFVTADEPADETENVGLAATAAAAAPRTPVKKASRSAAPRKKKPSMVGQLVGVVFGGLMSFPIVLGILWWGLGKDPLQVAPLVPDSLGFVLPAKLRSGAQFAAAGVATARSLDDVLRTAAGSGEMPADEDLAMNDPEPEPDLPVEDLLDPTASDLVEADPLPARGDDEDDDPLMALLKEDAATPVDPGPPPVPEPEPLDTAGLEAAAEQALAALAAVKAAEDLNNPVGRKLLVNWYRNLAAYAQELAMLERVAADTGRPLSELPSSVEAVPQSIADLPEMFEPLARLTRDWLAFKRRPSDGVLAPATFVAARQVGPYWRTEVALGDTPLVVLARAEPAAVPGETVLVTGLVIDEGVLWATEVRPAKRTDPFGL
jgi:hypothetical protein